MYVNARRCAAVLPAVKALLTAALTRLGELYPQAIFPPVTLAIGRTKPVGVGNAAGGVMIGLEALCHFDFLNPEDRKSTRLTPVTNAQLVCRLLLEKQIQYLTHIYKVVIFCIKIM